ncbi:PD-(D/E)XK nuclease-like domain-containing protein [Mycolicibacterium komossense]|uniref:PD-(D/E)XK nuclease-like domain-containing protein n=1 Tax=Mycolicibacterium komossense TaxID=1779 RepID=A0ABT3C9E8_9MYCO|nr:PD-(D/E)XK nuclease-like domain-containing protein [Mycolicibacterium komossense]MCV7226092.1 PD-(D/E)XK nuclease-like domain-containing protein [Mycolicibacterium komossense]
MTATGLPRENCENCGYAKKYSRQEAGERPAYCANHDSWLCAGCRAFMGCDEKKHKIEALPPRIDVTGVPANDGIYANIPDDVYHADLGSLSSSGARALLSKTPEEFNFERRSPRDPNRNFDFGHAAHKMVLGIGSRLAMLDPKVCGHTADGKLAKVPSATSEWKQAAAKARREGKLPIPKSDMEKAQTMAGRVFQHPIAARLLGAGQAEHSIYWHDDATGVRRRIRPDFLTEGLKRQIYVEYKTATSADPKQFQRAVFEYGYHMQQAYQEDGLAEIGLTDVGVLFIVQSKTAPYTVSVCQIDPEIVELGRRQNRVAIELFARCTAEDRWPGYEGIQSVGMAGWAKKQIEESLEVLEVA